MNPFSRVVEHLHRKGRLSKANRHRLVTGFWLRCSGVAPVRLLHTAYNAFRPGDDQHPANLLRWWGEGRLKVQRLQLWEGGKPDVQGVYTWHAQTAKTLVHHYELATPFGPVRFAGAVERATVPQLAPTEELLSVVRMGHPRDPGLYGPGGSVPAQALSLATDVEGAQSWRFALVGDRVRVEHLSEDRRLATDATLFALMGPAAGSFFKLIHDVEMRRGLRALPKFLMRMLDDEQAPSSTNECELPGREITLAFEQPGWLAWCDRPAAKRS